MLYDTISRNSMSDVINARTVKQCMRGSRKFCQRGSNFDDFFFFFFFLILMRGGRIQIPPLAGHQFKWRFAGGPMMAKH